LLAYNRTMPVFESVSTEKITTVWSEELIS
jgi:hypothetical protein